MVHSWGTKLTILDLYGHNARHHSKGQKKKKSLSHVLVVLKNDTQMRDKIEKTIILGT